MPRRATATSSPANRRDAAAPRSRARRGSSGPAGPSAVAAARASATDDPAVQVLQHLRELFRVAQQHFQKVEARCGVSGAQLWAMAEIDREPGAKISELARRLSIHLSTASNMLDKLEAKGYVRRERTPGDQRVVNVFLTPVGRKCLRRAPRPAEGVLPAAIQSMPAAAVRRLQRDLGLLLERSAVRDRRAGLRHLSDP